MKQSRLLMVIKSLSPKEIKELEAFLDSPFYNRRESVVTLFQYLIEQWFELDLIPTKEGAHQHLFPESSYEPQRIRQQMSWLLQLIEKYFATASFLDRSFEVDLEIARAYRQRGLEKQLTYTLRKVSDQLEKQPLRDADYYEYRYRVLEEQYFQTASKRRMGEQKLQQMSDNIDLAFLSRKLRQSCLALSHQAVYSTTYHFGLMDEILRYVEQRQLIKIPAIGLYYHGFRTLTQTDGDQYFQVFKNAILQYGTAFSNLEMRDLYLLAINFCIKKFNEGDWAFGREGLELYQAGLKSGHLLVDGELSRFAYRNIVAIGLKLADFNWVKHFIEQYKSALPKSHRESMYQFSLARLEYEQRNFDAAIDHLQQSEYSDLLLNLAAKTLLAKIYFQIDEIKLLDAHLEAMQSFIRRKRLMGYHKDNYQNFVRLTKKLLQLNPYDKESRQSFHQQVGQSEPLTEKNWLLEQLEAI